MGAVASRTRAADECTTRRRCERQAELRGDKIPRGAVRPRSGVGRLGVTHLAERAERR